MLSTRNEYLIQQSADEFYKQTAFRQAKTLDKMFVALFVLQFMMGIVFAIAWMPTTWNGQLNAIHYHIYLAVFGGGLLAFGPIFLVYKQTGDKLNQWVIAGAQILFSSLFIHLLGGRIETHFHIFGSLAFVAFYRDFRIVAFATAITLLDHLVRGQIWSESVYGVLSASPWRAVEHAAWVLFEDIFLYIAIINGRKELIDLSYVKAELKYNLENIESIVNLRTEELKKANELILSQQESLVTSAKMSILGEMSSGIAHEINNPLAVIHSKAVLLRKRLMQGNLDPEKGGSDLLKIEKTCLRISKIVKGLKVLSRNSGSDAMEFASVASVVQETVDICQEKFHPDVVRLDVEISGDAQIFCRPTEISQVVLNLLGNSFDVASTLEEKWVKLILDVSPTKVKIRVVDSGRGISAAVVEKIMQPFYTTKPKGKGTGLGLSISSRIAQEHEGTLKYEEFFGHTSFVLEIPVAAESQNRSAA